MISSSEDPPGSPAHWGWEDFARPSPDGAALDAAREARHAEEIDLTFQHGYREGQLATRADLNRHVRTAMAAVSAVARGLSEHRAAWESRLQEDLGALATGIARQIIGREVSSSPELVTDLVRRAVELFPTGQTLRARIHPADLHALTAALGDPSNWGDAAEGRALRWIPDPEVVPGSCVVEGPSGIVDGRVDAALERIYLKLTNG